MNPATIGEGLEAGSQEWIAHLRAVFDEILHRAGRDASSVQFSITEVYRGSPSHLAVDGVLGWTCRIEHGEVVYFSESPTDGPVDARVELEYSAFRRLAAIEVRDDPDRRALFSRMVERSTAAGEMRVDGELTRSPTWLMPAVHDAMAARTRSVSED